MPAIRINSRVKTILGHDKRDALDAEIAKKIAEQAEDGFELVSCNITSCENYNTVKYGAILMFKLKF